MIGYLPADYIHLEMCTLLYKTTFCVTIEYVLTNVHVYGVSPQGLRQKINSLRRTNGQIRAYQKSFRHKGVLNGMLFSTDFSSLYRQTSTDFEDIFTEHVA